jgi:hypothetical protein
VYTRCVEVRGEPEQARPDGRLIRRLGRATAPDGLRWVWVWWWWCGGVVVVVGTGSRQLAVSLSRLPCCAAGPHGCAPGSHRLTTPHPAPPLPAPPAGPPHRQLRISVSPRVSEEDEDDVDRPVQPGSEEGAAAQPGAEAAGGKAGAAGAGSAAAASEVDAEALVFNDEGCVVFNGGAYSAGPDYIGGCRRACCWAPARWLCFAAAVGGTEGGGGGEGVGSGCSVRLGRCSSHVLLQPAPASCTARCLMAGVAAVALPPPRIKQGRHAARSTRVRPVLLPSVRLRVSTAACLLPTAPPGAPRYKILTDLGEGEVEAEEGGEQGAGAPGTVAAAAASPSQPGPAGGAASGGGGSGGEDEGEEGEEGELLTQASAPTTTTSVMESCLVGGWGCAPGHNACAECRVCLIP